MRDYGKIHASFWTSKTISALSDDGRMLAAYLLTSPHANMLGCFRLPTAYACEDIGWTAERLQNGFEELYRNGFATVDYETKWIVIEKFLKWNGFENPNVGKAAAKLFAQIPDDCGVKHIVAERIREYGKNFPAAVLDGFSPPSERESDGKNNPIETVSEGQNEPYRNPEPEPEPNQNQSLNQSQNQNIPPGDAGGSARSTARRRKTPLPANFGVSERVREWALEKGHGRLETRLEHFVGAAKARGYSYVDWDEAFMNAIRDDWAKLGDDKPKKREVAL